MQMQEKAAEQEFENKVNHIQMFSAVPIVFLQLFRHHVWIGRLEERRGPESRWFFTL